MLLLKVTGRECPGDEYDTISKNKQHITISINAMKNSTPTQAEQALRFEEFQSNLDKVSRELGHRLEAVSELMDLQFLAAVRAKRRFASRGITWLRKAAGTFGGAVAPMSACKSNCSACCHVPVMLLSSEAAIIGREIGRSVQDVPQARRDQVPPTWRGKGHACKFLVNDRCSIYTSRPIACRLLFNLDRDALLCQHLDMPAFVPYADNRMFQVKMLQAVDMENDFVAELNDFFALDKQE